MLDASLLNRLPTSPVVLVLLGLWLSTSIYFIVLFVSRQWLLRKFPGPFAIPFLGNCYTADCLYFMRFICRCRKAYGRIFKIFAFAKAYLIISEPAVVRRVLSDTKTFIKGADYKDIFGMAFGTGLVTAGSEKHKQDRAIFGKYFVKSNINKYATMINDTCKELMSEKFSEVDASDKPVAVNMEKFFAVTSLRCFCRFSMNTCFKDKPELEESLCHTTSTASWAIARLMSLNIPLLDIFPPVKMARKFRTEIYGAVSPIVEERRAQMQRGECEDLDDCCTAMIRENMSQEDIADHMTTLVGAGHDTTAYFSAYMAYLLAKHPDIQEKLRAEVIEKLGDKEEITMEDASELKYLLKVMQETLRFYSIIPCVTREVTEEVTIKEANCTIPKGCTVMVPFYLMSRDPSLWDSPSEFIPERFDDKSNEAFTSAKNGFFPFGYGSRTCIGNVLAQVENAIFMGHLLRKYRFKPKPGFKPDIYAGISLTTSNGMFVELEKL